MRIEVPMFTLEHISKSYKKKEILKDISIHADEGECIGILGTNGAGKSTLLSCIATKYANQASMHMGYLPQENPLFDELKPIDNIKMWCEFSKSEILKKLEAPPLDSLQITDFLDTPVKNMSGGMKKRLGLATVLINDPKILLMDEPFAALDLLAKDDILSYMRAFLEKGGTIIAASHDKELFDFCNKVFLLKDGVLLDTAKLNRINYKDMLRS